MLLTLFKSFNISQNQNKNCKICPCVVIGILVVLIDNQKIHKKRRKLFELQWE